MIVRAEELHRAAAIALGPRGAGIIDRYMHIHVQPERPLAVADVDCSRHGRGDIVEATYQCVTFNKTAYARDTQRWNEWTIGVDGMLVRADALYSAIRELPPANAEGPAAVTVPVMKYRTHAGAEEPEVEAEDIQMLTFRLQPYERAGRAWCEWVLEVEG